MTQLDTIHIGFIGLGLMGKPMARNLKNSGARVTLSNRSKAALDELECEGFAIARSPAEAAANADIVICMVADTAAVEAVLFGAEGVVRGCSKETLVIDMGTTEVEATQRFASRLNDLGFEFADAPVSGGQIGAINGTLSIMVGASQANMKRSLPVLEVLGHKVVHIGEVGCGQIAKAANQIIVGLTIGAVAEAFALAQKGGADLEKVWQALGGGFAGSQILELHGRRMIESSYQPGGTVKTQNKDLKQALQLAAAHGVDLPSTRLCQELYENLIDQGDGELDHSALFRLYSD